MEELFRAEVLRLLLKKQLISEQTVNNMLSWRHSGFSTHAGVRVDTITDAARIGRYMIRCPLVLEPNKARSFAEVTARPVPARKRANVSPDSRITI